LFQPELSPEASVPVCPEGGWGGDPEVTAKLLTKVSVNEGGLGLLKVPVEKESVVPPPPIGNEGGSGGVPTTGGVSIIGFPGVPVPVFP